MIAMDATTVYAHPPIVAPWVQPARVPSALVLDAANARATTTEYGPFAAYYSKLKRIESEPSLWVEQRKPSANSVEWARHVLSYLELFRLKPSKVVATADGGVAFCFVNGNKYADIESLNSGAILGVLSDGKNRPPVWKIEPEKGDVPAAVVRIRDFIKG